MERIKKDKEEDEGGKKKKGREEKRRRCARASLPVARMRRRCRGNGRGESVLHIDEFTTPTRTRPCRSILFFLLPRPSSLGGKKFFNPRTVVYDIDEKSMRLSSFPESANRRRPSCNSIPPSLICFYRKREREREILTTFPHPHIDEFIANTARSIVTKIVYDIDSSFYVNPVSEWLCLTRRTVVGYAYVRPIHK